MPQNETLKALLEHARLVCLVKMDAIESKHGTNRSDLNAVHNEYKKIFGHLRNPKLWTENIAFDRSIITTMVLEIDSCDPANPTAYLKCSKRFLNFLKDDLLEDELNTISDTETSMWNLRMLNALRISLQQEDEREAHFKTMGNDLDNDPEFQAMKGRQQGLVSVYRELLKSNGIESDETKVNNMKTRGEMISRATELKIFFKLYGKLSDFIEDHIKEAGADPGPGDPPADSMAALNTLAITILKAEMKIDFFENQDIGLDDDGDYKVQAKRHPAALAAFHRALQDGSLVMAETDIETLADLGDSMQDDEQVSEFTAHLRQLNDLMENAVVGLS